MFRTFFCQLFQLEPLSECYSYMKNRTLETFVDKLRADITSLGEGATFANAKKLPCGKDLSSFDRMPIITNGRGWKEGEIFLIDDDQEALIRLIELLKDLDCEEMKIGVLFRVDGHTTTFCIEKKCVNEKVCNIEDHAEGRTEGDTENFVDRVVVYNIDSTAMDIDQSDSIRALVKEVAKVADIYSLAFQDSDGAITTDCKRQFDEGSCATFALHDIGRMVEDQHFYDFVVDPMNSDPVEKGLLNLKTLPMSLKVTMQSITVAKEHEVLVKTGLKRIVENQGFSEEDQFKINNECTSLLDLLNVLDARDEYGGRINPVINILNEHNGLIYRRGITEVSEEQMERFYLSVNKINENRPEIENVIHHVAAERFENGYNSSEENAITEFTDRKIVASEVIEAIQITYFAILANNLSEAKERIAKLRKEDE
jgi:hypothetical protein